MVGYARVSTEDQGTDPQVDELRTAGCATIHEEHASGADRSRPVLARLLREIRPDRLARSGSRLLAVVEQLEARGAHFRSLRDPIEDLQREHALGCRRVWAPWHSSSGR